MPVDRRLRVFAALHISLVPEGEKFSYTDEADDYLYHITSLPNAEKIIRQGLRPRTSGGTMQGSFYQRYSAGKIFVTERAGVNYWQERVEQHLFDAYDDPPEVAVLRLPRAMLAGKLIPDELGSRDARVPAYYLSKPVRPVMEN